MDTNGLIYDAVRVVGSNKGISNQEYEDLIIETVCNKISEYIALFRPSGKVLIAFDGVAPVAKLNQQRERRYKSWFTSIVEQTINQKMRYWTLCRLPRPPRPPSLIKHGIPPQSRQVHYS